METMLVFEPVDATEGLCPSPVLGMCSSLHWAQQRDETDMSVPLRCKDEVREREKKTMAALETARGLREGSKDDGEEDEKESEEVVKVLLLVVNGSFFLKGFLEVEVDYGI
ncbi:unnamed protein product [Eruca vesicaria subsp. sativa]|uniref:Uncharacterized protein n=1 Tax=Eruca vesicaria subsp. sativa TaxID=29727 RepID=A0ABC8JWW8_ERUVS|nr:unnamed protein product [Eruca vesicaria subsp. sativa]